MTVLVDSNVILDVATEDARWGPWSTSALADAAERDDLAINQIIYAEVSIRYESIEELEAALPEAVFIKKALSWEAAFLAGKVFLRYKRKGGTKRSPLPDFYIGSHAVLGGFSLLTRDPRRYRTYFPSLTLISP